jgi:NADH-quinone oxidoreductase subunit F
MLEVLDEITKGHGRTEDIDLLRELAEDVKQSSFCGLGRSAPNPVLSTLRYFPDEYEAHIKEGRCPALMCRDLIVYYILPERCERSCDACVGTCTVEAIAPDKKRIKVIDQEKCVNCGICLDACPPQYNAVIKLSPPSQLEVVTKK